LAVAASQSESGYLNAVIIIGGQAVTNDARDDGGLVLAMWAGGL
jgi:hypothetical protein